VGNELLTRMRRIAWAVQFLVGGVISLTLFGLTVVSGVLVIVWVGVPIFSAFVVVTRAIANVRRGWAGSLLGSPVPSAYLRVTQRGILGRGRALASDRSTWRDIVWLAVDGLAGTVIAAGALVESILGLIFWWMPRSVLVLANAQLTRALLSPSDKAELARRVQELTESRAETVDTQAAELRRIERDLHDGAQARLVSLGMSLGMAEELLDRDPEAVRRLLIEARTANTEALAELRDLVRGILPPVLADRGLVGAVEALALTSPVPVDISADVPGRVPAPVETAAYFAVAEAISNIIKHSGASRASVHLALDDGLLTIHVTDDGRGGAVVGQGSGLRGVDRRLSAFDGSLEVSSPPGGPTTLTMEVPCASSSLKTTPSSATD
jgi:signal transduction histidine kinase